MFEGSRAPRRSAVRRVKIALASVACAMVCGMVLAGSALASIAPENTMLPVVSGTVGSGHTLSTTNGSWSGTAPITFTYQWERCSSQGACREIFGATASSYVQVSADTGKLVLVAVKATNEAGTATATSSGLSADSWGQNDHGQLGAIYKDPYEESPIGVEGLTTIKAFSAAESFNLALLSNGTVASWGGDSHGQLGDDEYKANWEREISHSTVKGLKEVTAVAAANEHALALTKNGKVYAWGANNDGVLGQGVGGFEGESGIDSRIPNEVPSLPEKVKAIAVGGASNYALLEGGEVEAWGQNTNGELGVAWNPECKKTNTENPECKAFICKTGGGPQLCETTAHPVVDSENHPIKGVVAIAAGNESGYAVLESGKVLSWGSNRYGALGQPSAAIGSGAKFIPPGEVMHEVGAGSEPLTHVTELSGGSHHALAVLEGGEVVGWGSDEEGALGELPPLHWTCGKTPCLIQAASIKGLESVTAEAVAAGANFSLVLSAGQVYAFGRNERGELANGTPTEMGNAKPTIETSLGSGVREVATGPTHGLALVPEAPAPHITVHRESGIVRFGWAGGSATHLNYNEFTHPGLMELEEGSEEELGEGEGALVPKSRPKIKHTPVSPGNYTTLEQTLEGSNGSWKGAEPITYTYQWQRCTAPVEAACSNISGETTNKYKPTEADLGDYIRFLVTAKNAEVEGGVTVAAELTTVVTKSSSKEATKYSVNIKKEEEKGEITGHEVAIPQVGHSGEPTTLSHVPWEFKLEFGAKARWFVVTPLP
jgi:alpha-tubulin suppressor-like RCC1 family protein